MKQSEFQDYSSPNQSGYTSRGGASSSGNASAANGFGTISSLQTIGAVLRERRESAQVTLAEVEKATRIRQKYLAALEADEWHLLPGEVVGRGFLRNYANYLRLNTTDMMDRRRAMTDGDMARLLSKTSAGAPLPPEREIDYSPKDVDLEETPMGSRLSEYMATGRDWFGPIVAVSAVLLVALLILWGSREIGGEVAGLFAGLQDRATQLIGQDRSGVSAAPTAAEEGVGDGETNALDSATLMEPTQAVQVSGIGNSQGGTGGDAPANGTGGADNSSGAVLVAPTSTPTPELPTATPESPTPTPEPPTATPTPEPPTPTPTPEAPTPAPEPPTATPEPPTPEPAPLVIAPSCPDGRSVISSPGVNQVVSGVVPIVGSATHETFTFYKLEYAPGANAGGGYGYFDGASVPVQGGVLGNFNSSGVPNGEYTLQLVVVDATANYPPPCRVTITVQN